MMPAAMRARAARGARARARTYEVELDAVLDDEGEDEERLAVTVQVDGIWPDVEVLGAVLLDTGAPVSLRRLPEEVATRAEELALEMDRERDE